MKGPFPSSRMAPWLNCGPLRGGEGPSTLLGRKAIIPQDFQQMPSSRTVVNMLPLAALAFAAAFVAFEHFNGGVQTHYFLARGDLPGFSNWLSLLVLPLLGSVLTIRARSETDGRAGSFFLPTLAAGTAGSLVYGAALAASYLLGLEQLSVVLFFGLFVCTLAFPIYRAEFIFGFVLGMTIAFGSVIPLAIALFFAMVSFVLRRAGALIVSAVRTSRR
jgi:hypothetical protein